MAWYLNRKKPTKKNRPLEQKRELEWKRKMVKRINNTLQNYELLEMINFTPASLAWEHDERGWDELTEKKENG